MPSTKKWTFANLQATVEAVAFKENIMSDIYTKIQEEIAYQDSRWGNTDNQNTPYNWGAYINAYASLSLIGFPGDNEQRREAFKKDMIKVATLAIQAYNKL